MEVSGVKRCIGLRRRGRSARLPLAQSSDARGRSGVAKCGSSVGRRRPSAGLGSRWRSNTASREDALQLGQLVLAKGGRTTERDLLNTNRVASAVDEDANAAMNEARRSQDNFTAEWVTEVSDGGHHPDVALARQEPARSARRIARSTNRENVRATDGGTQSRCAAHRRRWPSEKNTSTIVSCSISDGKTRRRGASAFPTASAQSKSAPRRRANASLLVITPSANKETLFRERLHLAVPAHEVIGIKCGDAAVG